MFLLGTVMQNEIHITRSRRADYHALRRTEPAREALRGVRGADTADVLVMIMQFETVMSQPDRELLDKIITEKLERQIRRIEEKSP
jgi:hypothetical protein